MKSALRAAGSLGGVLVVAAILFVGAQAVRSVPHPAADACPLYNPDTDTTTWAPCADDPTPDPVSGCVSDTNCSPAAVECVPGEGVTCDSGPAPITPPPAVPPAGSGGGSGGGSGQPVIGPEPGKIEVSCLIVFGQGDVGYSGAILILYVFDSRGRVVQGAQASAHLTGPHATGATVSGTTTPNPNGVTIRDASGQVIYHGGSAGVPVVAGQTERQLPQPPTASAYGCHGSASYNGLSTSF